MLLETVHREFPQIGHHPSGSGLAEFIRRAAARANTEALGSDGLGAFDVSMRVADDQYLITFKTAAELTRGPVAGDAGQLVAVVVVVGKRTAHPVSPKGMSPELDLGSKSDIARQEAQSRWLRQLFQRLEKLRDPRADLTPILLKPMVEQEDVGIEEMPDIKA